MTQSFRVLSVVSVLWLGLGLLPTQAQAGDPVTRVLMVGDSWAELMWFGNTMRTVFANNGRDDIIEDGATTALNGSTAAEWTDAAFLQLITDALAAQPSIDVMQLSLGGNDFLAGQAGGGWHTGMTPQEFTDLINQVIGDLAVVIGHARNQRPNLEVLISAYDYGNFEDSLTGGCASTRTNLGEPTPLLLNTAQTTFQDAVDAFANVNSNVTSVRHLGLMQYFFGFPGDSIPPGTLLPPGDLNRPSPIEAMFLGIDCFHLSAAGYIHLGQNLWDQFYNNHFNGLFQDGFESGDTTAWAP